SSAAGSAWRWRLAGGALAASVLLSAVLARGLIAPDPVVVRAVPSVSAAQGRPPAPTDTPGSEVASASLSVYAGSGERGSVNGAAALARFAGAFGMSVSDSGSVYIADTGNHRIRSISTTGLV